MGSSLEIPSSLTICSNGRRHTLKYHAGETLLETARRGGIHINTSCEKGDCGACIVSITAGRVQMRANSVLSADDIASGLTLACQGLPVSSEIEIDLF